MSLYKYVSCSFDGQAPENAIEGGYDNGPSYHAKAVHKGITIPGKCGVESAADHKLARSCVPYRGHEIMVNNCEILTSTYEEI